MAGRLVDQGFDLIIWNRTASKCADFSAPAAESPRALAEECQTIVINVFDSAAVSDVLNGERGILAAESRGHLIIDTTTNHFRDVLGFHRTVSEWGGGYVEAPVIGSVVPAQKGVLTIVAGGNPESLVESKAIFDALGARIFLVDEPGLASKIKVINNLVLGNVMTALAEAVLLAERAGIDRAQMLDILDAGAGQSLVLTAKKAKLVAEDFSPHFSCRAIYKDLHYLQDLARDLRRPAFTAAVTKELYGLADAEGLGDEDFSAVYAALKQLSDQT
jgi:3-hydroxyisobutyrate dehydrogenase